MENIEDYEFEILDIYNNDLLMQHENGLFRAFCKKYPWYVERYFDQIDNERLRPKISYNDQIIYIAKKNKKIIIALSICTNKVLFEINDMGFNMSDIKNQKDGDICEGLHFYGNLDKEFFFGMDVIYGHLMNYVMDDLSKRGYVKMYSSCARDVLILYKHAGFEVIDKKTIDETGETEYFIMKEI